MTSQANGGTLGEELTWPLFRRLTWVLMIPSEAPPRAPAIGRGEGTRGGGPTVSRREPPFYP